MTVPGSQTRQHRLRRARLLASAGAALAASLATAAHAQSSPAPVPPIHQAVDGNGVDTVLDTFTTSSTDVSIGQSAHDGMAYTRYWSGYGGWRDSVAATLTGDSIYATVSIGGSSESFTNGVSDQGTGSTLTYNGVYTYTTSTGVVATFTPANGTYDRYVSNLGWATSISYPDGTVWGYTYKGLNYCPFQQGDYAGTCPMARSLRLQSVTNNLGYQLKLTYASNTLRSDDDVEAWQTLTKVTAINNAVESCNPSADSCSLSGNWPSATYALTSTSSGATENVTDALGRVKRYTYDTSGRITAIRRAGFANDTTTVAYGDNGVSSVVNAGVTTNYAYATPGGDTQTITVTDALNQQSVVTATISTGLVSATRDALGHTTAYAYDGNGRVTQVTATEGNAVRYAYDGRGNVVTTTLVAKPDSGLADIVTSASYPNGCASGVTCNKPTSTTDARGNVTGYAYDPTHGGVTSVTSPAGASGIAPQTRYGYTSYNGIWRLTSISTCRTQASCAGSADETKSSVSYTGTNLLATSVSSGAGDGSLTATTAISYDSIGNVTAVDGPLAGSADTTAYKYDADRELVGVVSADPDGAGPHPNRAVRYTYDGSGQPGVAAVGTVGDQSDAAFANFSESYRRYSGYDANGRVFRQTTWSNGTDYAVTDYLYDALGRPSCTIAYMDPSRWGPQASACAPLQTDGPNGPDRVTRVQYDALGRRSVVTSAYGTAAASNDVSTTYTPNGLVATQSDAMGNLTTTYYDGLDRLIGRQFPAPAQGSGASAVNDHEEYGYDANGNMTGKRLRDGQTIVYSYDALNRLTAKDVPNTVPYEFDVTYAYDLQGRLIQASDSNTHVANLTYDALGRKTAEQSNWTTRSWQYDLAGRRTRLDWGDGFFVTYDYDVTGGMRTIRENGGLALATFAYDDLGRRTSLTRGNGTVTAYAYDAVSRLAQLSQDLAGTAQDLTLGLAYNPADQIARRTVSNDAYAWTGAVNVNRGYAANGLNQYTQSGSVAPTYDARGNLTGAGSTTYGYTSENRLATTSDGYVMTYDPLGRYHFIAPSATVGTQPVTWMQYDGSDIIEELHGGSPTVSRRYVFGPGSDEPLVWYEGSGTSDRRYLHADERGSIVAVTNDAGAVIAIDAYDEYGIPNAGNQGRFQYTGQAWIPELGMYHYKARTYSPTLGRFLQTDPLGYGDGLNWYDYAHGDPVNGSDPNGLAVSEGINLNVKPVNPNEPPPDIVVTAFAKAKAFVSFEGGLNKQIFDLTERVGSSDAPGESRSNKPICGMPLKEPGKILYTGTTASLTFVLGGSFTKGSFTNSLTGTSGTFISYSFNAGFDVSAGKITGQFRDLASFNGGNDNSFSGAGAGPFGATRVTSYDLDHNLVGNSLAVGIGPTPAVGSSFSMTELTSIKQPGC